MDVKILPSQLSGSIVIPPSKSVMQRICALALLNNGRTVIRNPGKSDDDKIAVNLIKELGAKVMEEKTALIVDSNGQINSPHSIFCGESGLSVRMFAPILALSSKEVFVEGGGSLLKRSHDGLGNIFAQLNVQYYSTHHHLPFKIKGPIRPNNISIDGSSSSQYLTGLLFALGSVVFNELVINVENLVSKSYVDISIDLMRQFGYQVINNDYKEFKILPRATSKPLIEILVEGDWSGASFLLVAAAINGSLEIEGLSILTHQPDKSILEVLLKVGAPIAFKDNMLSIKKTNRLTAFNFDATDCPDLFPPLAVLALFCEGISMIKGVRRLYQKESNRAMSITEEFSKLGASIKIKDDVMVIEGNKPLSGAKVTSHHDHRIAMALSIIALNISGETIIQDAHSIDKSFPTFYKLLKLAGASVSLLK